MYRYSFIDFGNFDFIKDSNGNNLIIEFPSLNAAHKFVQTGGLKNFHHSSKGVSIFCWEAESIGIVNGPLSYNSITVSLRKNLKKVAEINFEIHKKNLINKIFRKAFNDDIRYSEIKLTK